MYAPIQSDAAYSQRRSRGRAGTRKQKGLRALVARKERGGRTAAPVTRPRPSTS